MSEIQSHYQWCWGCRVKLKSKCCKKFKKKGKACGSCPVIQVLGKKERKIKLSKYAA